MTNTIFTSKEQYLSFRAAWAKSVNTAKSHGKKYYEDFGSIAPEQHMLFNILRGKHPECGFTRVTNPNKLNNGTWANHASYYASMRLVSHISTAKQMATDVNPTIWLQERMERFLSTFSGTITIEMLAKVKFDIIQPIYKTEIKKAA